MGAAQLTLLPLFTTRILFLMLDNSSPIKTLNLSSHFKGFYSPSKKNPASHVLQRFGRDILLKRVSHQYTAL